MGRSFARLLAASGEAIAPAVDPRQADASLKSFGELGGELGGLLTLRNGFFSWGSALLVRPLSYEGVPVGLREWNDSALWKGEYLRPLTDVLCFAEDVFGGQYCLTGASVGYFDPETARIETVAKTVEQWCQVVIEDREFRTGAPLLGKWEQSQGDLRPGYRLLPKIPFAAGGKFESDNLYATSDVGGMRFRASLANQTSDLKSGDPVIFRIVKPS